MHTYCSMSGAINIEVRETGPVGAVIELRDDQGNTHSVYVEKGVVMVIALTAFRAAGMPAAQADRWAAMLELGGELDEDVGERQDLGEVEEDGERGDVDPDRDGRGDDARIDVESAGERIDALAVERDDFQEAG